MGHGLPAHPNVLLQVRRRHSSDQSDPSSSSPRQNSGTGRLSWRSWSASPHGGSAATKLASYIAGYTVANDVSARDWQRRASQWLLGKTFEHTTPIGPWLVTPDEVDPSDGLAITCSVDGVEKQRSSTSDLLFGPEFLVAYVSQVITLQPGDVILTGTPAGVGAAREPVERLQPGQTVTTEIAGLGRLSNLCVSSRTVATSH